MQKQIKKPREKVTKKEKNKLLAVGLNLIESLEYTPSLKWLFYQMLKNRHYKSLKDYRKFKTMFTKEKNNYQFELIPESIIEDYKRIDHIDRNQLPSLDELKYKLDTFQKDNDFILLVFYGCSSMANQFRYYIQDIPLIAFNNNITFHYKLKLSKLLSELSKHEVTKTFRGLEVVYQKPVRILYFGNEINKDVLKELKNLTGVDFEIVNKLPSKRYQWERHSDKEAKKIIEETILNVLGDKTNAR